MILEAEADLVPMGPRSPLRFGRCRTDVPRTSCNPSSAWVRLLRGRRSWVQGLASGSVGSWHEVPRTSLGLRSASVVAEQTSPGRLATHLPQGFGCCRAGAPWFKVSALHSIFRKASVVMGQAGYTYSVQNCILDQKERTSL